jgi:hypothetical protein
MKGTADWKSPARGGDRDAERILVGVRYSENIGL